MLWFLFPGRRNSLNPCLREPCLEAVSWLWQILNFTPTFPVKESSGDTQGATTLGTLHTPRKGAAWIWDLYDSPQAADLFSRTQPRQRSPCLNSWWGLANASGARGHSHNLQPQGVSALQRKSWPVLAVQGKGRTGSTFHWFGGLCIDNAGRWNTV